MDRPLESLAAEIFAEAVEAAPEQRAQLLESRCGADQPLRARVEALLASHAKGAALLRSSLLQEQVRAASATLLDRHVGRRIGEYEVIRLIASGGMGRVYLGRRRDADFDLQVAIKLLHAGLDAANLLDRFRSERRLLARLQHPNIARLLDGGSTHDGEPYLVMEYVDGPPLDRYCIEHRLSIRDRLQLFRTVCEAVQFAHRNLVVHRDLKPSNLLVDTDGHVKLLDFGIAKVLDPEFAGEVTATGYRAMTPRYASPEQLRGEAVTTATDVYSLGVVLYELLAGVSPYGESPATGPEFMRIASEIDPPPPSVAVAAQRRLAQQLAGDLDTIVLKALRKEPHRRYASAQELASDLERHLAGLPVLARPDTVRYRVSKFVRRNRALTAGVAVAFVALIVGFAATGRAYRIAARHQENAERRAYASTITAAESSIRTNRLAEARRQLEAAPVRFRGWEWRHLAMRLDRSVYCVRAHTASVTAVTFAADGNRIVTASEDSTIGIWDTRSGVELARFGPFQRVPRTLAVDPMGAFAAVGLEGGSVILLDLATGGTVLRWDDDHDWIGNRSNMPVDADARIAMLDRPSMWATVDFHPDGRSLVIGGYSNRIVILDTAARQTRATWRTRVPGHKRTARFHPVRDLVAVASEKGPLELWDPRTQSIVREFGIATGTVDLCFDPSGRRIAVGLQDQSIRVWDVDSGDHIVRIGGQDGSIRDIEFDHSGELIVATATDGQLAAWDLQTGRRRWTYPGATVNTQCIARSADGDFLASGDWDGNLRLWRFDTQDVRTVDVVRAGYRRSWPDDADLDDRGARLATTLSPACQIWDLATERHPTAISVSGNFDQARVTCVAWIDGARRVVTGMNYGWISIQHVDSPPSRTRFRGHAGQVCAVDANPEGTRFATGSRDSTAKVWALDTEVPRFILRGHAGAVLTVHYSPDGRRLATGSEDGSIRLWAADDGTLGAVLRGHTGPVRRVAFSADGSSLASASYDGSVRLWDVRRGMPVATLLETEHRMNAVAFTHDERRLAAAGADGVVRILDIGARHEVARLHGHSDMVFWVGFAAGDRSLISISLDGTIRIWDAGDAEPRISARSPAPASPP